MQKITAFFTSIIVFFCTLFGIKVPDRFNPTPDNPTVTPYRIEKVTYEASCKSIVLNWNKSDNSEYYNVLEYNENSGQFELVRETEKTTATIENLEADTTYKFKVKGCRFENGETIYGEASEICEAKTLPVPSKFKRNVNWGEPVSTYYNCLQNIDRSEINIDVTYVRGYPEQPGDVSKGGTFVVNAENDGGESVVFNVTKGKTYTISTSESSFYPGYHAKFGQVDSKDIVTGTKWYNAKDLLKSWNGKTSISITPEFTGICFVYLYNDTNDKLINNVTVTEETSSFYKYNTADEMYSLYDELTKSFSSYVSKTDLGLCSDGIQHLYEYDFIPENYNSESTPTIIIISGQHGYEKGSGFGVYLFFKDLCENYSKNAVLSYLRNQIAFKIIPVVNPYGWNNYSYYNFNGVNINRNYDNIDYTSSGTGTNSGGKAPFDQPESAIVKDFVERNLNSVLFIDNHTNTGEIATSMKKVLWIDTTPNQDEYYNKIIKVCQAHIENTKEHFNKDYNLGLAENDTFGTFTNGNTQYDENFPSADAWATTHKGIISMTFEGFNGFPGETKMYSDDCLKANAEMFGNFISAFINEFSKV